MSSSPTSISSAAPAPVTVEPRPSSEVPGLRLPRPLQSWLGLSRPFQARLSMQRRFGPVFQTNDTIAGRVFHIADQELIEQIFKWKPADYNVGEPRQLMEPVTGPSSILLLDGNRHMRMRKLMLPPFHGEAIAGFADLIEQIANREIDGWRPGARICTRTTAQAVTMEVIIKAVFGITEPGRVAEMKRLLPRLSSINPILALERVRKDLGPLSPWGRFVRVRDRVDEMVYEEIERRRAAGEAGGGEDILALLLAARDEDGDRLSDRELRDELITILLAGHETTATSIGWAFERLLRTPSALERLTAEVQAGESSDYMDAVIKETLRVRPVVTEVFRAPARPTRLGGYLFEQGSQLAASIMLVQYDPDLYPPDPQAFRPERFLEGAPERYTWIPFGGGVRRCLGAAFAQLEMKVVISAILRRARLRAARAADEKPRFRGVTVMPSRGGEAVVEAVSPAGG
jgi:cytochrome P450 family 135